MYPVISAGALAGAFGGLLSFGVSSIKHSPIKQYKVGLSTTLSQISSMCHSSDFIPDRGLSERYPRCVCSSFHAFDASEVSIPHGRPTYALLDPSKRGVFGRLQGGDQLEGRRQSIN